MIVSQQSLTPDGYRPKTTRLYLWTRRPVNRVVRKMHFRKKACEIWPFRVYGPPRGYDTATTYGAHFKHKAFRRYCLNYLRRILGMGSLPIQVDTQGRQWSKNATMLVFSICRWLRGSDGGDREDYLNKLVELLRGAIQDPDVFVQDPCDYIYDAASQGQEPLAINEISSKKSRSFDVLTIRNEPEQYVLTIECHTWNQKARDFDLPYAKLEMAFPHSRVVWY
jgi:hypothetical protein